jgi:glycosyltransferase involved in cell wall biosynthesis
MSSAIAAETDFVAVVTGYDPAMREHIHECVSALQAQTIPVRPIVVIDGRHEFADWLDSELDCEIKCTPENGGLTAVRNFAIEQLDFDVIAFLDDDSVPKSDWAEQLLDTLDRRDAMAVGGRIDPIWTDGRKSWFPREFAWLIGVTHAGFPDEEATVRNCFGSNMAFKEQVFDHVGRFSAVTCGRKGDVNIQGGETEFFDRVRRHYGDDAVWYNPDAAVGHKIFDYRTDIRWLLNRAFWQGYSKQVLSSDADLETDTESEFLKDLFVDFIPSHLKAANLRPVMLSLLFTIAVGIGYCLAIVRSPSLTVDN